MAEINWDACVLQTQLVQKTVNDNGVARIVAQIDERRVRDCPVCGGLRHIEMHDAQGYRYVQPCPGYFSLKRIEFFNAAKIPARFKDASFENFDMSCCREDPACIRTYMQGIRAYEKGCFGFLLEGAAGSGKTHLLCAAIRYLTLELGVACRYADFSSLVSDIRASYNNAQSTTTEWQYIEPLVTAPVLFLDELGKGRGVANEFELRVIDEIVNRRYDNPDLTTFFASNYRDRATSGYTFYCEKGYRPQASSPMASREWEEFAKRRWREENERRAKIGEVLFSGVEDFQVYVRGLMMREHIEDRVSERTASRIMAMARPIYINAPDYRRQ